MLSLPDGTTKSQNEVFAIIDTYNDAVLYLYDSTQSGPHDEITPIDLLALTALNAWGRGQPINAMTNAWARKRRDDVAAAVAVVSRDPLEHLSEAQRAAEVGKVATAINRIDLIPGFGCTASAKLFHRLRPNLGPIYLG